MVRELISDPQHRNPTRRSNMTNPSTPKRNRSSDRVAKPYIYSQPDGPVGQTANTGTVTSRTRDQAYNPKGMPAHWRKLAA